MGIRALYSAASGMNAQQMNIDNIANNLANSTTNGFKMRRAQFQDLLYQSTSSPAPPRARKPLFRAVCRSAWELGRRPTRSSSPRGIFTETDNPLDVAIQGNGFFQVLQPNGQLAYTRDGGFQLDKNGNVVDSSGNLVQPQITIPSQAQSITIAADGTVTYTQPGQTASQVAGQIQLALFPNPAGMNSIGHNLFEPTDASGNPTVANPGGQEGLGTLMQGYVEGSNVSVVEEFINMIVSQRAYEANSKVVKAADEMYQQINNVTQ